VRGSLTRRSKRNPLRPEAHADDPAPTALVGPTGLPGADDRRGVHLTTNFDRAVWYAMTKACNTRVRGKLINNTGIVFEIDVTGLTPEPDFDAEVERAHSMLGDSAYIVAREFELEPGNRRDRDRLRSWLDREAEQFGDFGDMDVGNPLRAIAEASGMGARTNVFAALAELAHDDNKADEIIEELRKKYLDRSYQLPLYWFAHAVQQWRFFVPVDDDRLVEATVIKPFVDQWYDDYEDIPEPGPGESNDDVIDGFTIDDADNLQLTTLVVWKRPGKRPRNTMFHGTDLWRARQIFPRLAKYFESPWPFMMASENCANTVVDDSKNPTSMLQLALPGVI